MKSISQAHQSLAHRFDVSGFMDAMQDEVVVLDSSGTIVATNKAWRKFSAENGGNTSTSYIGSNYLDICRSASGPSSTGASTIPDGFADTLRTGAQFRCEYPCDSPTTKRWFELTANRLEHDGAYYLLLQHRNITIRHVEQTELEQAYINSSAMIALVATTSDPILSYDLDGNITTWNGAAERMYGYTAQEAVGQSVEILYPENWPKPITYYRDEILAGRLESFEATRVAKNGSQHEVWIACAPIRSVGGDIVAISNIHRDISEVRNAEKSRDLIAHEVIHRAKNMLSIVIAIQRQTARVETTVEGFKSSFEARLQSLSKSTDLLVKNAWTSVGLKDLVKSHLEPFVDPNENSYSIAGPEINLPPQCVQAVGMAFHELATNSAKHGAFMQKAGKIAIDWKVIDGETGSRLHLCWHETDIAIDQKPERKGFGGTVLTSLAPTMINADSTYVVGEREITWSIDIPEGHFVFAQ